MPMLIPNDFLKEDEDEDDDDDDDDDDVTGVLACVS